MPTWGTVLSPAQIRNQVALLRVWETGEVVELPGAEVYLQEAVHAFEHNDLEEVVHLLEEAANAATGDQLQMIEVAINALRSGDAAAAVDTIEEALAMGGSDTEMPEMETTETIIQPGENEARAALEDLERGDEESAIAKLRVALVLAQGELKEAIEHSIEDVEAGNIQEAIEILRDSLGNH